VSRRLYLSSTMTMSSGQIASKGAPAPSSAVCVSLVGGMEALVVGAFAEHSADVHTLVDGRRPCRRGHSAYEPSLPGRSIEAEEGSLFSDTKKRFAQAATPLNARSRSGPVVQQHAEPQRKEPQTGCVVRAIVSKIRQYAKPRTNQKARNFLCNYCPTSPNRKFLGALLCGLPGPGLCTKNNPIRDASLQT
jgi:hypothetical protein